MALSAELESLISELDAVDPAAAKEQRALLEKHPSLQKPTQEQRMRQSDYSRRLNEDKDKLEFADKATKWYQDNKPIYDTLNQAVAAKQKELDDLKADQEKKIKEAVAAHAAGGGGTGTGEGDEKLVASVVAKLGDQIVTPTKLAELIAAEVKKGVESERKTFFETTFPEATKFSSEFTEAQILYFKETGNVLDREKFAKFVADQKITSPIKALDEFMKPDREKKHIQSEVDRRLKEELDKRRSEGVPGSSGAPGTGALEIRMRAKDPKDGLFGGAAELGDGSAAAQAATELNNEGK